MAAREALEAEITEERERHERDLAARKEELRTTTGGVFGHGRLPLRQNKFLSRGHMAPEKGAPWPLLLLPVRSPFPPGPLAHDFVCHVAHDLVCHVAQPGVANRVTLVHVFLSFVYNVFCFVVAKRLRSSKNLRFATYVIPLNSYPKLWCHVATEDRGPVSKMFQRCERSQESSVPRPPRAIW